MPTAHPRIMGVMTEVFAKVQESKTSHQNYVNKLKKLFGQCELENFWESFELCLKVPLSHGENNPCVENTMQFAARFAASLQNFNDSEENIVEQMCPFLCKLFDFLLTSHECSDAAIRFRICHFLTMLLNSMGEDASIDDNLCDRMTNCMMDRLLDKSHKVRAQAVFALQRLQDPTDDQCPVIKMYLFHLLKDPSAEVRQAVIFTIGKNQKALQAVLTRTRDTNEKVRKAAFKFVSKITVKSLTIKQRETLLRTGLSDRSESVRKVVRDILLPAWLQHFKLDFINLLRALDAEMATETAIMALEVLFNRTEKDKLLEQIPLDQETKLIPVNLLNAENVLFWKCFVQYLYKEGNVEMVEECLPELTKLCDYIRDFQILMSAKDWSQHDQFMHRFVLYHLFELTKTYDLADEVGRASLSQLIQDTLMSENVTDNIIDFIVKFYELVVPDVSTRLNSLAHVISEIRIPTKQPAVVVEQLSDDEQHERLMKCQKLKMDLIKLQNLMFDAVQQKKFLEAQKIKENMDELEQKIKECSIAPKPIPEDETCEEKNDPETMLKCLQIMCSMAQAKSVTTLTSTLRSIFDHMAVPSLEHPHSSVRVLALKAVAICLLLDQKLAQKYLMIYFMQFTDQENLEGWVIALKAIFDLFLRYGLEYFDIIHDESNGPNTGRSKGPVRLYNNTDDDITGVSMSSENGMPNHNIVRILIQLLDNGDREIRTLATAGFCKLLLHRKLTSDHLVSRLIILLFNPATEDDVDLRQILIVFFQSYVAVVPESRETLDSVFLPTLRTLMNAPTTSPLHAIEPHHIASFIINLTNSQHHKSGKEDYTVHNNLAISILAETLTPDSEIDRDTLLKSLKYLNIRCDTEQLKNDMIDAVNEISRNLPLKDKSLRRCLTQFMLKIEGPQPPPDAEPEQAEQEEIETDDDL